eukprot:8068447-Ditylum_brightwellii.AAC.1
MAQLLEKHRRPKQQEQQPKIFLPSMTISEPQGLCKPKSHKICESEQQQKVCESAEQREYIPKEPHE